MKQAIFTLIAILLLGCASPKPLTEPTTVLPPLLPSERRQSVWLGDQIAPYAVGRYVDPRNPNVVHEAHTLYRREQSSRPNLTPPSGLVFPAPDTAASSVTNVTGFLRDALSAELNQQRAVSQRIIEQSKSLQQQVETFTGQTRALRESLDEAMRLRGEINALTNRLDQLEQRLRQDNTQGLGLAPKP